MSGRTGFLWFIGSCAAGVFASAPATANATEILGSELTVSRSPEASDCPDEEALARATLAHGRMPEVRTQPLRIDVSFERGPTGYFASIRTSGDKQGTREIEKPGDTCAALAETTSVVLAVLLDVLPAEEPSVTPPIPSNPPPVLVSPSGEAQTSDERSGSSRRPSLPPTIAVGVQAGAAYGLTGANTSGLLGVAVRPRIGIWGLSVGALWVPTRSVPFEEESVDISLLSALLEGCGWFTRENSRFGASLCGGFLFGILRGHGRGFDQDRPASDPWFAAQISLSGELRLGGGWSLRLGLSGVLPFRTQTFSVDGTGVVFRSAPAAFLAQLGPELRFP